MDFNNLYIPLNEAVVTAKAATPNLTLEDAQKVGPVIAYGSFITVGIDFLIVAMVVFMVIKALSRMKKAEEAAPVAPPASEVLLTEIRDLLKK